MGTYVFKLPDVGEGIARAEIVAWHVRVGEEVAEDQPVVDVMTEKATVEICAPVAGRIVALKGETGEMAAIGDELIVFATDGESGAAEPQDPEIRDASEGSEAAPAPLAPARPAEREAPRPAAKTGAAPAVRARAARLGIDLAAVRGSGPGGRVTHEDLDDLLVARGGPRQATKPAFPLTPSIAPARRGSSAALLEGGPSSLGDEAALAEAAAPRADVEEVKVIGLRRMIAERMSEAKRRIPHFAYVEEVDVTALEELRRHLNAEAGRPRLTVLPFLIRAMVKALPGHPGLNAHFDDEAAVVRRHAAVHVGVATQTRRGLLVPVVRHAEARDIWQIAAEIARLSEAARNGKAPREELSGSTITISSLGPLGGVAATPIINPPEVAIVGVNKIVERPVVLGGQIAVRRMMNLSSSFDHRVVDGFDAAAFIQAVKGLLEVPARLFVD